MSFASTAPIDAKATSVFLPKEHGSWSLALEPLLFGLLVAYSPAAGALAVAAAAAFFMRRPIKRLAIKREPEAARVVMLLGACAAGGLAATVALGGWTPLLWLLPTLPFAWLFVHWDSQKESRATHAELAACGIFAFLPAVMAEQAGLPKLTALALCVLMLARSLPTVLIVRTYLRRRKGQRIATTPAAVVTAATLAALLALGVTGHMPWLITALAAVGALRLLLLLPKFPPVWSARRLGITEACFGAAYVLTAGLIWPT
ncbi:MAG: YwiC-like family protein [Opitutaceae bacterium]|nr:YwiC-like family protein [Opitutaceae bacterium]